MIPWFVILFIPAMLIKTNKYGLIISRKRELFINIGVILAFFFLFFFRGFRSFNVGGDVRHYETLFYELGRMSWQRGLSRSGYEVGYLAYCKILYKIYPDYRIVLIISAVINSYAILRFVCRNSVDPSLSLFCYIGLFFYAQSFNNERQAVAISLLMIAYEFVQLRKKKSFLLFVLFATSFHISSLLFVVLYFLVKAKFDIKYWISWSVVIMIAIFSGDRILGYVIKNISFLSMKYAAIQLNSSGAGYRLFLLIILTIITQFVFFTPEEREEEELRVILHMLNFSAILQCFSFRIGFFARAVQIYYVAEILYFPKVIAKYMEDSKNEIIVRSCICIIVLIYFVFMLYTNGIGVVPYSMGSL